MLAVASFPTKAVDHSPKWTGTTSLTYNLVNLDPDLSSPDYAYCRWGNWIDYNSVGEVDFKFNWLTKGPFGNVPDQNKLDLFLSSSPNLNLLYREDFPVNSEWQVPGDSTTKTDGKVSFLSANNDLTVFRYFHFNNTLINRVATTMEDWQIDADSKKVVILIHGWNPGSDSDP